MRVKRVITIALAVIMAVSGAIFTDMGLMQVKAYETYYNSKKPIKKDVDGDGKKEKIEFKCTKIKPEICKVKVIVDGKVKYTTQMEYSSYCYELDVWVSIVDYDKNDSVKDLIIRGPQDGSGSTCGWVVGYFDKAHEFHVRAKGTDYDGCEHGPYVDNKRIYCDSGAYSVAIGGVSTYWDLNKKGKIVNPNSSVIDAGSYSKFRLVTPLTLTNGGKKYKISKGITFEVKKIKYNKKVTTDSLYSTPMQKIYVKITSGKYKGKKGWFDIRALNSGEGHSWDYDYYCMDDYCYHDAYFERSVWDETEWRPAEAFHLAD